jgi:DNA phosphorothioation-associated putative methyltransferase
LQDGIIRTGSTFFDFGCGRGGDVAAVQELGIEATGWDPVHSPLTAKRQADVVNLGYVVNVIENAAERAQVLQEAWRLTRRVLVVSARLDWEVKPGQAISFGDGILTSRGTFQKFFTQEELELWIKEILDTEADAAAPGIFYVFRSAEDREAHLVNTVRRRRYGTGVPPPAARFDENREILEPLLRFLVERGRAPAQGELEVEQEIVDRLGSLKRALTLLRRVADVSTWERTAIDRQQDLLVYLALGAFRGRPKFSVLPRDLQFDIKAFFGSYTKATRLGQELLFATGQRGTVSDECTRARVGKLTPDALYAHVSALQNLPVLLRVYEGCARMLLGDAPGATVVKLRRDKPRVSYLCYPDFDDDPHPMLSETFVADLGQLRTFRKTYADRQNPPVLHRKELFVSGEYPNRSKFSTLTQAEADAGLLSETTDIGTRNGWHARLASMGYATEGHSLVRVKAVG